MDIINSLKQMNISGIVIVILIFGVFAVSFILNLTIRRKYLEIEEELEDRYLRKTGRFKHYLLNMIVEDYKRAALESNSEINTQAIIEKCFNIRMQKLILGERFVNKSVSVLIILGLLGTFLGLTIAVGRLANLLGVMVDFDSITAPLLSAIGGMAVAFTTSLVGIGCSIILTVVHTIYNAEESRETLMVHIEEYLDNTVAVAISKDRETEYTILNQILRETFVEFGEKIEGTLKATVENFGKHLSNVVMDVHVSSKSLDTTVDKFDRSLANFAGNIHDLSEFNNSLKNNIERMDVNFIKVSEAINNTSQVIVDNYNLLESFSKDIREAADEMTAYNRQVVQDIGSLVGEVKTTVSSIKELGEVITKDLDARTRDIQQYQEKFSGLMTKLSEEISLLGKQTADSFSQSLTENGKIISSEVVKNIQNVLKEIFLMLDVFKENEKILAKTITMLPDQTLTYNEAAVVRIGQQLDEIKGFLKKADVE